MLFAFGFQQAVPGQKEAENALGNLASQGILGSICVLLAVALFLTIRTLLKSKDDRIADQKAMADALGKVNEATKDLAIEMKEHAAAQTIEANRTHEKVSNVLGNQEKALIEVRNVVSSLQQEQARLAAAVTARSGTGRRGE